MYILWSTSDNNSKVELNIPEEGFLNKVNNDFLPMMKLFEKSDGINNKFGIIPTSKAEAEWMIATYCKLCELKQPLPSWLTYHFNTCFLQLLNGAKPANALGLTNPARRPKEPHLEKRNKNIYSDVRALMEKGDNLFGAALAISEKYGLHESNIQNIYGAIKKAEQIKEIFKKEDQEIPF